MCFIMPEDREKFKRGEISLAYECRCTKCNFVFWKRVKGVEIDELENNLKCPKCNSKIEVQGTHYPN